MDDETNDMMIADEPHKIEWLRLLYLKRGLYLEINTGMKSRGGSAYKALKEELGIKGNRQKVLDQVNQMIQSIKDQQQGEA